jgi:vitamin B12 transporter
MNIRFQISILFLFYSSLIAAQQQDSLADLLRDTISVNIDYKKGLSIQKFGKEDLRPYQSRSVAQLLATETGVFIKQYGPGLATATSRGGGAGHTAILWEGINIASPMLGQNDLSLIPIAFVDQLSWQASSASATDGNAAIGGSIHLKSFTPYNSSWKAQALFGLGSFGKQDQQLKLSYGGQNYASSLRFFHQSAKNNFKYIDQNAFGDPKPWKRQEHAFQTAMGLMHSHQYRWKSQEIKLKSWYQQNFRELPPTLFQTSSANEEQSDRTWRNLLSWQRLSNQHIQKATAAWIWNQLNYQSDVVDSRSQTQQALLRWKEHFFISDPSAKWQHQLSYRLEGEYQKASSTNFSSPPQQWLFAAAFHYKIEHQNASINLNLREQWVDQNFLLPAAAIHGEFSLLQEKKWHLAAKAAFSQNYRYPTFNDRYWPNAGNPDLKAEYSWSQEGGLRLERQTKSGLSLSLDFNAYSNWVDNWIIWLPSGSLWRPENILKVWARGTETDLRLNYNWNAYHQLGMRFRHQWTIAQRRDADPDAFGRQLIHTPKHKTFGQFSYQYKALRFSYQHSFTGARFLDYDNNSVLLPFQLANLQAQYNFSIDPLRFSLQLTVDNLWGTEYYILSSYPMPRQNLDFSLLIEF